MVASGVRADLFWVWRVVGVPGLLGSFAADDSCKAGA